MKREESFVIAIPSSLLEEHEIVSIAEIRP